MDYKGYDYTELFPALGIVAPQIEWWGHDEEMAAFKDALLDLRVDFESKAETIANVRAYVDAMAGADKGYWTPIWNGLSYCSDNYTFVQACHALAEHMWT